MGTVSSATKRPRTFRASPNHWRKGRSRTSCSFWTFLATSQIEMGEIQTPWSLAHFSMALLALFERRGSLVIHQIQAWVSRNVRIPALTCAVRVLAFSQNAPRQMTRLFLRLHIRNHLNYSSASLGDYNWLSRRCNFIQNLQTSILEFCCPDSFHGNNIATKMWPCQRGCRKSKT